jgi:hypothetical protein
LSRTDVSFNKKQKNATADIGTNAGSLKDITHEGRKKLQLSAPVRLDWGMSNVPNPTSALQRVVLLILNELRYFSAVLLHYIMHRFLTVWYLSEPCRPSWGRLGILAGNKRTLD